jgi:integrase
MNIQEHSPVSLAAASGLLPEVTPKVRLTKAAVRRLSCPSDRDEVFHWDDEVPGLAVRVYKTGRKVWTFQYRDNGGSTRRMKLGHAPAVELAEARKAAKSLLAKIAGGADPAADRKKARQARTVGDVFEVYLGHAEREQKASTFDQTRRNLTKYAAKLRKLTVDEFDRAAAAAMHQKLGNEVGRVQANRTLASVSAAWTWALKTGFVEPTAAGNPAAFVPKFAEQERERVLSEAEVKLIWDCTAGLSSFERIVRVSLLTGCRRQEIGGLRWTEIDGDLVIIPAARMKGGQAHEVPLSALALEQLPEAGGAEYVFSLGGGGFEGWSRTKAALDTRIAKANGAAIPQWGLHDLRRTFSTMAHERRLADPHVIEAVLAHEGAQAGVAGVYNRAAYRDQKRMLLDAWADEVARLVSSE